MGPLVEFFVFKSSRKEKKWPAYRQKKPKMAADWRGGRLNKKKSRHLSALQKICKKKKVGKKVGKKKLPTSADVY